MKSDNEKIMSKSKMSNEKITRMARIMKSRQGRNKKQDENNVRREKNSNDKKTASRK